MGYAADFEEVAPSEVPSQKPSQIPSEPAVDPSVAQLSVLTDILSESGYLPADPSHQLFQSSGLDINQIFVSSDGNKALMVSFAKQFKGVTLGQKEVTPKGVTLYRQNPSGLEMGLLFYGRDWSFEEIDRITDAIEKDPALKPDYKMQIPLTVKPKHCNLPLGITSVELLESLEAAEDDLRNNSGKLGKIPRDRSKETVGPEKSQNQLLKDNDPNSSGGGEAVQGAFSCLKSVVQGVWDSAKSNYDFVTQAIKDPWKAWDQGVALFESTRSFLSEFEKKLPEILHMSREAIAGLDRSVLSSLLCSLIGEIGTESLIGMLAGGGGLPKAIAKLTSAMGRLSDMSGFIKLVGKLKVPGARDRIRDLVSKVFKSNGKLTKKELEDFEVLSQDLGSEIALTQLECKVQSMASALPRKTIWINSAYAAPQFLAQQYCQWAGKLTELVRDPKKLLQDIYEHEVERERLSPELRRGNEYNFSGIRIASFERARNMLLDFPLSKHFRFDLKNPRQKKPLVCNAKFSPLYGKNCGWQVANDKGETLQVRIDMPTDEFVMGKRQQRPSHFNLTYNLKNPSREINVRLDFDCGDHACTSDEVLKLAQQMGH